MLCIYLLVRSYFSTEICSIFYPFIAFTLISGRLRIHSDLFYTNSFEKELFFKMDISFENASQKCVLWCMWNALMLVGLTHFASVVKNAAKGSVFRSVFILLKRIWRNWKKETLWHWTYNILYQYYSYIYFCNLIIVMMIRLVRTWTLSIQR